MNLLKYTFLFVLCNLFLFKQSEGQNTLPLNLTQVLELSGANNLTVKSYQLMFQQSMAEEQKAREWWLPDLYAGPSTHYLTGAAMNTNGEILSHLNRNNLWLGIGAQAKIDFNKGKYNYIASKQNTEARKYESQAEKNKAILKGVQLYLDLQKEQFKYNFLSNLVMKFDSLDAEIKAKVDAGLTQQSEYLLSQVNINHLKIQLLLSKNEWQKKSSDLAAQLNLQDSSLIYSADSLLLIPPVIEIQNQEQSITNRPEFNALSAELQSLQTTNITVNKGLYRPTLNIGADNGLLGAYIGPPYNTFQVNASLLWHVPFGNFTYHGDKQRSAVKIMEKENEIAQFKNLYFQQISKASHTLNISGQQIKLAKENLDTSKEVLNQSLQKQKTGIMRPFEVIQAQQMLMQSEIDYLDAVTNFNKAYFEMIVAKGGNL